MGRFLKGYGFVPWSAGGMQGWYRQTAFVKDCLAGEIARYYADDYIVIRHEGDRSVNWLREHWQSREDVMTHRFLLLDCHETRLTKKFLAWYTRLVGNIAVQGGGCGKAF